MNSTLQKTLFTSILLVFIVPNLQAQNIFGDKRIISQQAEDAVKVFAADIDGDGDMDVLSASEADDKIAWYENQGNGDFDVFNQNIISENINFAVDVAAADFDGDGDMEVIAASRSSDKIVWFINDGAGNFGEEQLLTDNVNGVQSVQVVDLDIDGDIDIVSASNMDNKVAWYMNDGTGNFSAEQIISDDANAVREVQIGDINGDGHNDVLVPKSPDFRIRWYENDGSNNFPFPQNINNSSIGVTYVHLADFNGDAALDVLAGSTSRLSWYENDGDGYFMDDIDLDVADYIGNYTLTSVFVADLDNDGDLDPLMSASFYDRIFWFANDGNGNFGSEIVISNNIVSARDAYPADIDGDGDLDIIAASFAYNEIAWFENTTIDGVEAPTYQSTLGNTTHEWYIASLYTCDDYPTYKYEETDNVVTANEQDYTELLKYYAYTEELLDESVLLREENGKLYRYDETTATEVLIMDMSLELGDSFTFYLPELTPTPFTSTVTSIEQWEERKVITFDAWMSSCSFSENIQFIEGMIPNIGFKDTGNGLLCYFENGVQLYQTPYEPSCIIATDVAETTPPQQALNIQLQPNPAQNRLQINFNNPNNKQAVLNLLNIAGQTVQKVTTYQPVAAFTVSKIPAGVYFCKVQVAEQVVVEKVVIGR